MDLAPYFDRNGPPIAPNFPPLFTKSALYFAPYISNSAPYGNVDSMPPLHDLNSLSPRIELVEKYEREAGTYKKGRQRPGSSVSPPLALLLLLLTRS